MGHRPGRAGAIILVNVLALGVGIYLQQAATRPSWVKSFLTHDGGHGLIDIKGGGSIVEHREAFERKVDELLALAAKHLR